MCRGRGICCVMEPSFKSTTTTATTIFEPFLLALCPLSQNSMKLTYQELQIFYHTYMPSLDNTVANSWLPNLYTWGNLKWVATANILQSDKMIGTQAELPFASPKWFWLISLQKDHWWIFPFISKLITRWHSFGLLYNNPVGDSFTFSPIIRWCGYFIRSAAIRIKIFLFVDFLCCWILWEPPAKVWDFRFSLS